MNKQLLIASMRRRHKKLVNEIKAARKNRDGLIEINLIGKNSELLDWINNISEARHGKR